MNVIVACEKSGVVRDAFRALGHDAWSCDTEAAEIPASGVGHSFHIRCDVRRVLDGNFPAGSVGPSSFRDIPMFRKWDLMIAHPPCQFLSSSGLHWNVRRPERAQQTKLALEFVRELDAAPIARRCFENPVGAIYRALPDCAVQWIQPYQFGHDASKRTGLRLRNLPPLVLDPGAYVPPRAVCPDCKRCSADNLSPSRAAEFARDMFEHGCPRCGCEAGRIRPRWENQTDSGQNKLGPSDTRSAERARTYPGIAAAMASQWGRLA